MKRLDTYGAMPNLNPMAQDWAELLWANNPQDARTWCFNPFSVSLWDLLDKNNRYTDSSFMEYQRACLKH